MESNLEQAMKKCTCGARRQSIRWALAEAHAPSCPTRRLLEAEAKK